LCNIVFMS